MGCRNGASTWYFAIFLYVYSLFLSFPQTETEKKLFLHVLMYYITVCYCMYISNVWVEETRLCRKLTDLQEHVVLSVCSSDSQRNTVTNIRYSKQMLNFQSLTITKYKVFVWDMKSVFFLLPPPIIVVFVNVWMGLFVFACVVHTWGCFQEQYF